MVKKLKEKDAKEPKVKKPVSKKTASAAKAKPNPSTKARDSALNKNEGPKKAAVAGAGIKKKAAPNPSTLRHGSGSMVSKAEPSIELRVRPEQG